MYNTETIERFIDLAPKNDLRTQTKAAWGSNIFWLLISLIGFGAGGAAFAYGIIIICLVLFASVFFQIKRKDKTVYGGVFLSSFLSLLFVINFTLTAEIFCELPPFPADYSAVPFVGTKKRLISACSSSSSLIFLSMPPAYPVRLPFVPTTR